MKKGFLKALILVGVFIGSVVFFEIIFNTTGEDLTSDLAEATLPVVYLKENDQLVNELYGYTEEMDGTCMRDTITPLNEDLTLPIRVKTYSNKISSISYQIRSFTANRLIEDDTIKNLESKKGLIDTSFQFQNILEKDTEYLLLITLECNGTQVHYYSRIIDSESAYTKECVEFALKFHQNAMDGETDAVSQYLETDAKQSNEDLHQVDIHSSSSQVCWASFKGKELADPVVSIKEINSSYHVITLSYVMTSKGSNGELEYYNVEEDYRIRYSTDRMYLLEYERTMNQIFRGENSAISDEGLSLGIRNSDVDYMNNENGTDICFVQEGELWSYSETTKSLAKVFSFRGYEGMDTRENNKEHEIKIIKVDETGSADFIVYGYMSRGNHEGKVGIAVYHFDSVAKTVEEQLWIPSKQSYQVIKEEVGRILYVSEGNYFYMMVGGTVYQVNLTDGTEKILASGTGEDWIVASSDNSRIAWANGEDENKATSMTIYDMESQESTEVQAGENEYIRPLGFLNTDFVYGVAKQKRVTTDAAGNTFFPMNQITIISKKGDILKQYHKNGYFVSGITIEGYTIYLNRVQNRNGSYVEATQDSIVNMSGEEESVVSLVSTTTKARQTQWQLTLSGQVTDASLKTYTPKIVLVKKQNILELKDDEKAEMYYAYSFGRVNMASTDAAAVIREASDHMGVVIDSNGTYIWERARKTYQSTLSGMKADTNSVGKGSVERCLSVLLKAEDVNVSVKELLNNGNTAKEILNDTLSDAKVLDLTGCNIEELIYYVSNGTPVYALTSSAKAVLIVGYDSSRITIYDPSSNSCESISQTKAEEIFNNAGNVFLAYLKNQE